MAQVIVAISPQRTDHTAASFGVGMLVMQLDRFRSQLQAHVAQRWPNDRPHRALLTLAALMYRSIRLRQSRSGHRRCG